MFVHGWMPGRQIVYWAVPLGDPPGDAWGEQAWEVLWYLRTHLWFVLLSPLLLRVFRLAPVPVLPASLVPIVVLRYVWQPPDDRLGTALPDLATYLFCRLLGFAHRDGVLERLRPAAVLAQALWSAGFVTLLMYTKARRGTGLAGLSRFRRLDCLVSVFNARAVTVYLWHEPALVLAVSLIDLFWEVPAFERYLPLDSQWFLFAVGWVLIAAFVLLCGWVEDVAAKKKPRLLP
jgi:hypothetical protein